MTPPFIVYFNDKPGIMIAVSGKHSQEGSAAVSGAEATMAGWPRELGVGHAVSNAYSRRSGSRGAQGEGFEVAERLGLRGTRTRWRAH